MSDLIEPPRAAAARMVSAWRETGDFPDRMVDRVRNDHALVMEMTLGAVRWVRLLDFVAGMLAKRRPEPDVEGFLLVGLYQLLLMPGMAEHAAVHETVEAAKQEVGRSAADFINAILRRVTRDRDKIKSAIAAQPLGVRLSHPDELLRRWTRAFGEAGAAKLCEWNNAPPDVVLRVNPSRVAAGDFLVKLDEAGVRATAHAFRPDRCISLPRGIRVAELPGYREGLFAVQDPSTLLAPELLDAQPGETVLDACAAPGGKTVILAEQMGGRGTLLAMDLHEDRLKPLRENLARLGHAWVTVVRGDAICAEGRFDRILLDVPCSNTGVIRRRADARWRFSTDRLAGMVATQTALLDHASSLLKPGGTMVYSTCSLESEEDETLIANWLKGNPAFTLKQEMKLFPPESGTDGAYVAAIKM